MTGERLSQAERIARNDHIFRCANEDIRELAEEHGELQVVPFICECADGGCTRIVPLTLDQYTAVREHPRLFINALGHGVAAEGLAVVVEEHPGYEVVEKRGKAGEIVERLACEEEARG